MMNFKKIFYLMLVLALLIFASGCNKGKSTTKAPPDVRTGTEGLAVSFVANNPPSLLVVENGIDNPIKIVLQLNNKGAYPQPNEVGGLAPELGRVYISGFDQEIIDLPVKYADTSQLALEGKSSINPNGGIDFKTFDGNIRADLLNVEKYDPTFLATICYGYVTVVGPQVCIDPDPYSTISQKKVCQVQDTTLSSQGAPVAVTSIKEEALATRTQFRITIKNVGSGDIIKTESFEKCNPSGTEKLAREDIDKVYVQEVTIAGTSLQCGPFIEDLSESTRGYVRLINGEGTFTCKLNSQQYASTNTAYTTPLKVKLSYVYKTTAERKIQIKKEVSDLISGPGTGIGTTPSRPSIVPQPNELGP